MTLIVSVGFAGLLIGVFLTEHNSSASAQRYADDLVHGGYTTLLIEREPQDPGDTFAWSNCTTLRVLDGVLTVFALNAPTEFALWAPEGPKMPLRTTTAGLLHYLGAVRPDVMTHWDGAQVLLDTDALGAIRPTRTQAQRNYPVVLLGPDRTGPITPNAFTVPLVSLGAGSSGNGIAITPPQPDIGACIALADPDKRATVAAAAARVLPPLDGYSQQWTLGNADRFQSPRERFNTRASRWYWLPAAAIFAAIWALTLRINRSDYAVYAVAGLTTPRLSVLITFELLIVTSTAALIATAFIAVAAGQLTNTTHLALAAASTVRTFAAATLAATVISAHTAITVKTRTIDALKDR